MGCSSESASGGLCAGRFHLQILDLLWFLAMGQFARPHLTKVFPIALNLNFQPDRAGGEQAAR